MIFRLFSTLENLIVVVVVNDDADPEWKCVYFKKNKNNMVNLKRLI